MYQRVVVPLDGSPVAEGILPFILEIAAPLDLAVVLLRVEDVPASMAEAEVYLAGVAGRLRARGVRVETLVRGGEAAGEILAGARAAGADLIAMTTHGRTGLGRLLFGSIAEAVLRRADIPVFLMRLEEAPWQRTA